MFPPIWLSLGVKISSGETAVIFRAATASVVSQMRTCVVRHVSCFLFFVACLVHKT
jgi:hypothetical protein